MSLKIYFILVGVIFLFPSILCFDFLFQMKFLVLIISPTIELSIKYSKDSIKTLCLLKTRNKEVGVGSQSFDMYLMGEFTVKLEDNNSMVRGQK
jgi:hypothetical protein